MDRRIYLVNAFNTTEHFELAVDEAMKLLRVDAVTFCLGDSLDHNFIAVHPTVDESSAYSQAVEIISAIRRSHNSETNPLTGEPMKIINLFRVPHPKANSN